MRPTPITFSLRSRTRSRACEARHNWTVIEPAVEPAWDHLLR
jgi:hypothetical protein